MTFDDGLVKLYVVENIAEKGNMPEYVLSDCKAEYYFQYEVIGYNRFYTAMASKDVLEAVIDIDLDRNIRIGNVIEFEDGDLMKVIMAQHPKDEDGLWYTRLSLSRITDYENYR